MGLWERYGGTRSWWRTPTLEVSGDISVVGVDIPQQSGVGALVAIPPDGGGIGALNWIIKGGLLGKPRTGALLSNFILGFQRQGDVVVVRYEENLGPMTNRQMQLAFRGRDAALVEAELVRYAASWQRVLDEQAAAEAEDEEDLRRESAAFTPEELAALTASIGVLEIWDNPDEGDRSSCGLSTNRLMDGDSDCLDSAPTYFLSGLMRRNRPDLDTDTVDDEYYEIQEYFVLCPRCIRDLQRRDLLVRYRPAR